MIRASGDQLGNFLEETSKAVKGRAEALRDTFSTGEKGPSGVQEHFPSYDFQNTDGNVGQYEPYAPTPGSPEKDTFSGAATQTMQSDAQWFNDFNRLDPAPGFGHDGFVYKVQASNSLDDNFPPVPSLHGAAEDTFSTNAGSVAVIPEPSLYSRKTRPNRTGFPDADPTESPDDSSAKSEAILFDNGAAESSIPFSMGITSTDPFGISESSSFVPLESYANAGTGILAVPPTPASIEQ
ncbi:hypothetical protein HK405_015907, partial [Cladochytrium tenue]